MIKKFIDNLISKSSDALSRKKPKFGKRVDLTVQTHGIDPKLVDERALNVVRTLHDAGFEA
jgi:poly(A) polymerase